MVRELNINKQEELRKELKAEFPSLSDVELDQINASYDELVDSISVKTHRTKEEVARIVDDKLNYIYSKIV